MGQEKNGLHIDQVHLRESLEELCEEYPVMLRNYIQNNTDRFLYQVTVVAEAKKLLDIGAGYSPCSIMLSRLGANITIVDDFNDPMAKDSNAQAMEALFAKYKVNVVAEDTFMFCNKLAAENLDAVMCFDSMEHWHNSPKKMLHDIYISMKKGSLLFIGVPNCVNLRKRITVPFGFGKWSSMADWYESDVFRGHVREPDVGDLEYIAKDLGFKGYKIEGRNWIGYRSKYTIVRMFIPFVDKLLQLNPALCSDLYLITMK